MCAYNGVYLLVFTTVSVGLHAHQHPGVQDSHVLNSLVGAGFAEIYSYH